jgi:hypothetical protein
MHNLGKEFEAPKSGNRKKWEEIERRHKEIQALSMTIPKGQR